MFGFCVGLDCSSAVRLVRPRVCINSSCKYTFNTARAMYQLTEKGMHICFCISSNFGGVAVSRASCRSIKHKMNALS